MILEMSATLQPVSGDPGSPAETPLARSGSYVRGSKWHGRRGRVLGLVTFVALSFFWFSSTWADPLHRHAGSIGDPESYLFALLWPPFAVTHHMNPFSTTYLLAPKGANLMWTVPPGFGLLLWPLTATIGPVLTYNLLATLSLGLSAWTAQLALRRFVPGEFGPFSGGLFYGFSPYMATHSTAHVMLTMAVLPPLLLLLIHETFIRQQWRPAATGLAIGVLLALQLATFLELLAGAAVASGILIVILAVAFRQRIRERLRYVAITAAVASVTFAVVGGYPLWTLLFATRTLVHVHGIVHPANVDVASLAGFVVPSNLNAIAPSALRHLANQFTVGAEVDAYIGLPLLILTITIAVKKWHAPTVRITSLATAAIAILSMGPRLHLIHTTDMPLPWAILAKLPLMGNLLPVRLAVFTDLGIALLIAYAIAHRSRPASRGRNIARLGVTSVVVATLLPSAYLLEELSAPVQVPAYFTSDEVRNIPAGSVALVAPWTTDTRNDLPEIWQAFAGFRFRMTSGYANVPSADGGLSTGVLTDRLERSIYAIAFGDPPPPLSDPAVRDELQNNMRQEQIRTVIVGPMKYDKTMVRFMQGLLGRPPERTGGVYVWYNATTTTFGPALQSGRRGFESDHLYKSLAVTLAVRPGMEAEMTNQISSMVARTGTS